MVSWIRVCAVAAVAVLGCVGQGEAQQRARASAPLGARLGIGYVVNAPNQLAGVSGHVLTGRFGGLGLYVDAKFDIDEPGGDEFVDSLTANEVDLRYGDTRFSEEGSWMSVNVALMRPLTPDLIVYAGAGYSDEKRYVQYYDINAERGNLGYYWVEDDEESGSKINPMGGVMLRIQPNIFVQFGLEGAPVGGTVGVTYSLPLR